MEAARAKDPTTARRTSTVYRLGNQRARNTTTKELGPQRFQHRGPDLFRIVRGALPGAVLRLPGLLLRFVEFRRVLGLFRVYFSYVVII